MRIYTLLPEAAIEAFNLRVVRRRAWPAEVQFLINATNNLTSSSIKFEFVS